MVTVLETQRLLLRPWHAGDLEGLARLASDPLVMRHIGDGTPWSRELTEKRSRWQLDHWREHSFGWRAAIGKASGRWLGFVGINYTRAEAIELDPADVEIGWWLEPSEWGKGLATEGALALRDEAFESIGIDRLFGRCQPSNRASARVMVKIGMQFERNANGRHGEIVSIHSLDRPRWQQRK